MDKGSHVITWGPSFGICSVDKTMLRSTKPIIAITAVRTGVGKSQTTRYVSNILKARAKKVVAVRHPMPYGDLAIQACQRFETYADLDKHLCTIEEREEYEPHIDNGFVVYAGVAEIVDCKPYGVGAIKATYEKDPNSGDILPRVPRREGTQRRPQSSPRPASRGHC
jgi:predicted GTPase